MHESHTGVETRAGGSGIGGLLAAVTTPVNGDLGCDANLLEERCRYLMQAGCDGLALFGTTGEGPLFPVDQRLSALDHLFAASIDSSKVVVSASAMTLSEIAHLARHATDAGCAGVLLMPPFFFRQKISESGAFQFYAAAIKNIARPDLKLILYHFPEITGVSITPGLVRRLIERFPGVIVGIKDSGGDWDFTDKLLTRFSDLSILTGTEVHVPHLLAAGGAGTICGLANVMPGFLRRMFDAPTFSARRRFIPHIHAADAVMSRGAFICCLKAMIAADTGEPDWLRVLPPLYPLPAYERQTLVADFRRFEASVVDI
jgi:4-hydroxy-tetrahydrodipicolinate synthase